VFLYAKVVQIVNAVTAKSEIPTKTFARTVLPLTPEFDKPNVDLRYLDFKKLKIDCDFIRTLGDSVRNRTILSLIIQLGHILKIPVLAEGIETTEQKDWLEKNGCDFGQGFWFSRPLPIDQLLIFLKKKKEN
jgi:hypothetical protein